ncbi:hypothetical protein [Gemmata palustris]|nr:hypothetical protein [Gemmata palustris]
MECSIEELHQHIRNGWPKCCTEVQTHVSGTDKPPAVPKAEQT